MFETPTNTAYTAFMKVVDGILTKACGFTHTCLVDVDVWDYIDEDVTDPTDVNREDARCAAEYILEESDHPNPECVWDI
jgi:hypothetical protein